jgi:DNA-binding PadR family transcriptional regulator
VSVPNGFLALLTLGPAYGSQLQKELLVRAPHRGQLNAGQVYATLERLRRRSLIERAGETEDGLPLYRLTAQGESAAREWLTHPAATDDDWWELQDQALIAASVDADLAMELIEAYRVRLTAVASAAADDGEASGAAGDGARQFTERARLLGTEAALQWLGELETRLRAEPEAFVRIHSSDRPRRGRRQRVGDRTSG